MVNAAAAAAAGDLTLEGETVKNNLLGPERRRCRLDIQVSGCSKTSKPSYGPAVGGWVGGELKSSMCFSSRSQRLMIAAS